jgi:hypothetical protein
MSILNYENINPKKDNKKPFLDKNGFLFFNANTKKTCYYLECIQKDEYTNEEKFYILVGETIFDKNCRVCKTDNYGRIKIKPCKKLKNYIDNNCDFGKNINIELSESNGLYTAFRLF